MKIVFQGGKGSLRGLSADMSSAGRRVGSGASKVIRSGAKRIERDARQAAPVDTGELRGSIVTTFSGDGRAGVASASIGPTARHGLFVEFGTSDTPAQPFLFPALDRHADDVTRDLAALIDDAL